MSDPVVEPKESLDAPVFHLPSATPQYSPEPPPPGFIQDQPEPAPPGFPQDQPEPAPPGFPQDQPGPAPPGYPQDQPGPAPPGFPQDQPEPAPPGYPQDQPGPPAAPLGYPQHEPGPPPYYGTVNPNFCPSLKDGEPYPPFKPEECIAGVDTVQNPDVCTAADDTPLASSPFEDETVRRAFIRKVFSILFLQLLFTFSVVCVFTFSSVVREAVQSSIWPYVSSYIVFIIVVLPLSFCPSLSRRHPWNLIALMLVTVSLSYMVGTIASYHDTVVVIITMGATLAISLAIIAYSMQTRYDFTVCYGLLLILVVDLFMFGIFSTFYYSHMAQIAYGTLGALLFSLFLMADVQLMTGTMSYRISPEDYVTAALNIYLDIILIFLYLLGRR